MESVEKKNKGGRGLGRQTWSYYGGGYQTWYTPKAQPDLHAALSPLVARLQDYDRARLRVEQQGGPISLLGEMSALLKTPVDMGDEGDDSSVVLLDPSGLNQALRRLSWDLRLEVRVKATRLPVYYLCRTRSDYWSEYSFVVEDYHLSPGYPLTDSRFVKLMQGSHEQHFLRLSPYRQALGDATPQEGKTSLNSVDEKLYQVGRHVLLAAWHQDQEVGMACARHLGLPRFAQAVELLYLCLNGELCELRGAVDDMLLRFFAEVYPQEAIARFLERLRAMEGSAIHDLPRRALTLYAQLSRAFSAFLGAEVAWQPLQAPMPLWKLVYGNLSRLDLAAQALGDQPSLNQAKAALEKTALEVGWDLYGR